MCVCVEGVAKSHFHVNQKKKETKRLETNMYKYVMRGVCFGAPQPRWFAISQKNKRADLAGGNGGWEKPSTMISYNRVALVLLSILIFWV